MNILEKIAQHKVQETALQASFFPVKALETSPLFERQCFSLKQALQNPNDLGIIAEFKRRSPSKGVINATADVAMTTQGYAKAGAAGLSILTDVDFFGGENRNLKIARKENDIPILRKDFIISEYQIIEAKAIGADVILLIAEILTKAQIARLSGLANSLGLEVLLEVHSERQLEKISPNIDILGVNNRDLTNFEVSIETSIELFDKISKDLVCISESGISHAQAIKTLRQVGFDGFLIGEYFMASDDPAAQCAQLINEVNKGSLRTILENKTR